MKPIPCTGNLGFVENTPVRGRPVQVQKAWYRQIAERLFANPGIRKEDILVVLTENDAADWSSGMAKRSRRCERPRPNTNPIAEADSFTLHCGRNIASENRLCCWNCGLKTTRSSTTSPWSS